MTERVRGEKQDLYEAIGRTIRIRSANAGSPDYPAQQLSVTIPRAIASLMFARTELWKGDVTDEGVLLCPIDKDVPTPAWARKGSDA